MRGRDFRTARRRRQNGNAILETAMFVPILILLLMGMTELARLTYTYYTLQKILYTLARYVGTQQAVNFCDASDAAVLSAKSFALTGTTDSTATPVIANLTADMIQVRIERIDSDTQTLGQCECSITGCDTGAGGQSPDFIVVSIPDGYSYRPVIPYLPIDAILFKPRVRLPFGGT
jgi:hypothetical protein